MLLGLAVVSEAFRLETKTFTISAAFLSLVLAMILLGPAPAVCSAWSAWPSTRSAGARRGATRWRTSPPTRPSRSSARSPSTPLGGHGARRRHAVLRAGGLRAVHGDEPPQLPAIGSTSRSSTASRCRRACATSTCRCCRSSSPPACSPPASPSATATATSAAIGLLAVIGLVFQYLLRTALSSMERKEQLEGRTRQLAALQVGVLGTVLQTLSLRDKMTARHSAAVARYSREIALELGLSEREQEIVHTAGLLHDIGKFIFPDSILFADYAAHGRAVRDRPAPSRAGGAARRAHRGLRADRRDHPRPPRAHRRPRLPRTAWPARRSRWPPGSSPSRTPMT